MNSYQEQDEAPYTSSRKSFAQLSDSELEQLFNLAPVRSLVHRYLQEESKNSWAVQESEFLHADSNKRTQWLFATHLLASYGMSIPQVAHQLKSVPPSLQLDVLTQKRSELITRFAGTEAGRHWMMCMKLADGWKYMAQYTDGDSSRLNLQEVENFLMMLDHIAIIHDLIKGRGRKYGLNFKAVNSESAEAFKQYCKHPEKAQLILDLLHQYIDGKDSPKRSSRPLRAALDADIFFECPPFTFINKEFGELCKIDKSSYYAYVDKQKECPYDDELYHELVETFSSFA